MAITGKPLAATAGAMMFQRGGNAVDAACAMIAATSTMWDTLCWGGETQALVYDPRDAEGHRDQRPRRRADRRDAGVLSRARATHIRPRTARSRPSTPGTPGGLMVMLAEYGTLSLAEVLAPAIELADGYPIEAETADRIERWQGQAEGVAVLEAGHAAAPRRGARSAARGRDLPAARPRRDAAQARRGRARRRSRPASRARTRSWPPTTASTAATSRRSSCAACRNRAGSSRTTTSRTGSRCVEEPVQTTYRGIDVYKLDIWTQGPAMLQALNILENFDLHAHGLQQRELHPHASTRR